MIELKDVSAAFEKASFTNTKVTKHVAEFQSRVNGRFIYVDCDSLLNNRIHLIIEEGQVGIPSWIPTGVRLGNRYHNSNMRQFDKRLHRGKNPIHYGVSIIVPNLTSTADFLSAFNDLR